MSAEESLRASYRSSRLDDERAFKEIANSFNNIIHLVQLLHEDLQLLALSGDTEGLLLEGLQRFYT